MSRQRSTWSQPSGSRQAATKRQADIYTMNQERVQPSPVEYQNGDPDSWAETPVSNKHIEMEYDGDHVKRNEVGFAEFREDTWKHKDSDVWGGSGKYDNQKLAAAKDKAARVEKIARHLLRTTDDRLVGGQMLDLMGMPEPVVAATLKRISATTPEALTAQQKLARATACCKLAAHVLPGASQDEGGPVEKLARTFATLDDPTLKSIIRQVHAAQQALAAEEDDEKEPEKTEASAPAPAAPEDKTEASAPPAPPAPPPAKSEACGEAMSGPDMAELDALLHSEMGQPSPELTQLFTPPAPAAPMGMGMPAPLASAGPSVDIQFGDDELDASPIASTASAAPAQGPQDLDSLFSDHPEVMAQRQIRAAEYEAAHGVPASGGYGQPGVRTASTQGAKKIGHVQATAGNPADDLSNLWR